MGLLKLRDDSSRAVSTCERVIGGNQQNVVGGRRVKKRIIARKSFPLALDKRRNVQFLLLAAIDNVDNGGAKRDGVLDGLGNQMCFRDPHVNARLRRVLQILPILLRAELIQLAVEFVDMLQWN